MLLYFDDQQDAALRLAEAADLQPACIARHRFPDGEVRLRLPATVPGRVTFFCGLHHPNEKLVELLLATRTARNLGAQHLTLVAPYLAYMRQDMEFEPGEAVSQRVIGRFLADLFDAIVTVDPHLHRVATLQEAAPVPHAVVLTGAEALSDLITQRRERPILIGPDSESAQWVERASRRHGLEHTICKKVRSGDRDVRIVLPGVNIAGRATVILDDMASTGNTVAAAARLLQAAGAGSIDVAVTHALFMPGAEALIRSAGVQQIWSTDCIAHSTNAVPMAPLFAQALKTLRPQPGAA